MTTTEPDAVDNSPVIRTSDVVAARRAWAAQRANLLEWGWVAERNVGLAVFRIRE